MPEFVGVFFMWEGKEKNVSLSWKAYPLVLLSFSYLLQGSGEAVLGADQVAFFPVLLP